MPYVNILLNQFLGLTLIASFAFVIAETANGSSEMGTNQSLIVHLQPTWSGRSEPVQNNENETNRDPSKTSPQIESANQKVKQIDWLLLDLKMGVVPEDFEFGEHVPMEARTNSLRYRILQQSFVRLRAMRRQIPRLEKELVQNKQRLGPDHPTVKASESSMELIERYLEKIAVQWSTESEKQKSSRENSRLEKLFQIKPTQAEAKFSKPSSLNGIFLGRTRSVLGYEAKDDQGKLLRRFIDTNLDNVLDTWIYYNDGKESHRETDTDFDEIVDEVRMTNGNLIRVGKDTNRDSKIDSWNERTLDDTKR